MPDTLKAPCPKCGRKGLHYADHPHAIGMKDFDRLVCRFCGARLKKIDSAPAPVPVAAPSPLMTILEYRGMAHLLARISRYVPIESDDYDCIERALDDAAKHFGMTVHKSGTGGFYLEVGEGEL